MKEEGMVEKSNLSLSEGGFETSHYYGTDSHFDHHAGSRTMPVLNKFESQSFCAGCGIRILDRYYLLAVDKQWHVSCLKCSDCKIQLDSELTCFARGGNIFCKDDYFRRFGVKRCARCHQGIAANELVMKARDLVYHINCFTCSSCHKALSTGDQFGMKENLIYCRNDYELLFQGEYFQSLTDDLSCHTDGHLPFYNGVGTVQKGRPRKRKNLQDNDLCPPGMGLVPGDGSDRGGDMMRQDGYCSQQPPRQKRVRTSFKHHQLRTMKSYFNLNHNPDAKDLKQLSQKTGLSKRVLQVWFQNARAKHRRNQMKSDGDKPEKADDQSESGTMDDDKIKDSMSMSEITDSQSPMMSDISDSPSLSELQSVHVESDHSTSSLSDLFTNSINSIN
ncbi:LHX2_9 [Mytilus edulis]|uniref:LHX2_9 n=1 Tax=Mytilus edulis TaxID=6550 RepID=A0A8S3UFT3_MYTED|nr:LHX2_9 [Mytilus edulis]